MVELFQQSDAGEQRILTEKLHDLVVLRLKEDYERAGKVPPSLKRKKNGPKPRLKVSSVEVHKKKISKLLSC